MRHHSTTTNRIELPSINLTTVVVIYHQACMSLAYCTAFTFSLHLSLFVLTVRVRPACAYGIALLACISGTHEQPGLTRPGCRSIRNYARPSPQDDEADSILRSSLPRANEYEPRVAVPRLCPPFPKHASPLATSCCHTYTSVHGIRTIS